MQPPQNSPSWLLVGIAYDYAITYGINSTPFGQGIKTKVSQTGLPACTHPQSIT
jgi:hypothetical protein